MGMIRDLTPNEQRINNYLEIGDPSGLTKADVSTLYGGVSSGQYKLSPEQFDRLIFNNSDLKSIDRGEFSAMSPEVQKWARENPQAFIGSLLQHRNPANQDIASIGAEGGVKSLGDLRVGKDGSLDWSGTQYLDIHDDGPLGGLGRIADPITRSAMGATNAALSGGNLRDITRAGRDEYRAGMGDAIDAHQQLNRKTIKAVNDAQLRPLRDMGVSEKILNNPYLNPESKVLAVESLASGDARLANSTKNLNSGAFSKQDRVAATLKDQEGLQIVKQAGAMAAATGIPIVSWIGMLANGVANQRLSEAGVQSGRAGLTNFGGAVLGGVTGGAGQSLGIAPVGPIGQVGMGAARGALAASGSGGNIAQGALTGGLGAYSGVLGQQIGGAMGSAVGGGLGSAVSGYARGERGGDLARTAFGGALAGATGAYGKDQGWNPALTGLAQQGVRSVATGKPPSQQQLANSMINGGVGGGLSQFGKAYGR